jgi:large subunit ribosomal protein L25
LAAVKRETRGSSAAAALRRKGRLPAVVYGEGRSRSIEIDTHTFEMMLSHHAGENLLIDMEIEGEGVHKVLLKEIQQGPVRGELLHVDFLEISMARKMRVMIPVEFVGEPLGVSQQGGILEHVLREVEVECLPGDLVDSIPVDVSALNIGNSLLVRDLKVDAKLTILTSPDVAIASVTAPRAEAAPAEAEAAEAEAGTEPEVIGKKKEEGEEGEEKAAPAKGEKAPAKGEKAPAKGEKPAAGEAEKAAPAKSEAKKPEKKK